MLVTVGAEAAPRTTWPVDTVAAGAGAGAARRMPTSPRAAAANVQDSADSTGASGSVPGRGASAEPPTALTGAGLATAADITGAGGSGSVTTVASAPGAMTGPLIRAVEAEIRAALASGTATEFVSAAATSVVRAWWGVPILFRFSPPTPAAAGRCCDFLPDAPEADAPSLARRCGPAERGACALVIPPAEIDCSPPAGPADESCGDAQAVPDIPAPTTPIPRATASPPTRPIRADPLIISPDRQQRNLLRARQTRTD